ncbi:hypothetical protein Tco_0724436, partial [Tanacetum coccineum]
LLRTELENVKQEKEGFEFKIAKFEISAKDLDQLLASQITDGFGYNVVPSPHPLILNRPTPLDLSYSGLEEFKEPEVNEYGPRNSSLKPTTGCDKESDNSKENTDDSLKQQQKTDSKTSSVKSPLKVDKDWKEKLLCPANHVREEEPKKARENNDAPIIEDWVSDDEDDDEPNSKDEKKSDIPTVTKKEFVKPEKPVRRSVSCPKTSHPSAHKHMAPKAVLMKTGLKSIKTARPVNTVRICADAQQIQDKDRVQDENDATEKDSSGPSCIIFDCFLRYNIIFGSTKKELCDEFEKLMKDKFQMSSMGELTFFLGLQDSPLELVAYTDSDYAGATQDRKSTTGGCQFLGNRLISWQCKKQTVVATSTTKAEYVAVFSANCYGTALASPKQTAIGKDYSNPLMAGSLPKTILCVNLSAEASTDDNGDIQSSPSHSLTFIETTHLFIHCVVSFPSPTQPTQPSPETEQHIPTPHDSPLHVVHSHGSDEGSLKLIELTNLVTKLSKRIGILEDDLKKTKLTYSAAVTKLILRVKKLEFQVKTGKSRKRARVVLSEDDEDVEDDSSKQGRKLSDAEVQEKASNETEPIIQEVTPTEVIQDQGSSEKGNSEVSTAGATKGTASEVPVVSTAEEKF